MHMGRNAILLASFLPCLVAFADLRLGIIYSAFWFDKVIIGIVRFPRLLGIEFVTLSSVATGMLYGIEGALVSIIVIALLEGVSALFVPKESEMPPFVPTFSHVVDGAAASAAFLLKAQPLGIILFGVLLVKYVFNIIKDKVYYSLKPIDIGIFTNIIFNAFLFMTFRDAITWLVSV